MHSQFLVARFSNEHDLREAVRQLRGHGFRIFDAYTPYPVHGLAELMGVRRSRLPIVSLCAALVGLGIALGFQFYAAVFDWPLNVGGKPPNSTLAFVPITFEITVLCAGLATAAAFLVRSRLLPGARPCCLPRGRPRTCLRWSCAAATRPSMRVRLGNCCWRVEPAT